MARRRLLITGAGGLLGDEVARLAAERPWSDRLVAVALARRDLDVTDAVAVRAALEAHRPEVVVNCAGYTRVDDAEQDEAAAVRLNALAPGLLATACVAAGVRLVHLSSDYVFDGGKGSPYVETDLPAPLSVYGRTKLEGERAVEAAYRPAGAGGRWLVVRSQWLYGRVGPAFVKTILARAREGAPLRVVDDQWGAPTWGRDLAEALFALVESGASGVVHVANGGRASWYEVAVAALELVGLAAHVEPVSTAAFPRPARRPPEAVLDTARYRSLTGRSLRHWREALAAFLGGVSREARCGA